MRSKRLVTASWWKRSVGFVVEGLLSLSSSEEAVVAKLSLLEAAGPDGGVEAWELRVEMDELEAARLGC